MYCSSGGERWMCVEHSPELALIKALDCSDLRYKTFVGLSGQLGIEVRRKKYEFLKDSYWERRL